MENIAVNYFWLIMMVIHKLRNMGGGQNSCILNIKEFVWFCITMDEGVLKSRKTALRNMWRDIHKLRNLIFPLKRYVIYGCLLNHHNQPKLTNCNVIPLYLVSFAVILQLKLGLTYFIRNIHGYPWIWISITGFWSQMERVRT